MVKDAKRLFLFVMLISLMSVMCATVPSTRPISVGEMRSGRVSYSGQQVQYNLLIQRDEQVVIEMFKTSGSIDPYLILQDGQGDMIARDDDGAGYPNSRITRFLNQGSYRIIAKSYGSNRTGGYTLSVRRGSTMIQPGYRTPQAVTMMGNISSGQTRSGSINYPHEKHQYNLYVSSGNQITVELFKTGGNIDPYLVLQNSYGNIIARNDDGAGFPNSRIIRHLNPGNYRIIARGLGSTTGSYNLSVMGGGSGGFISQPEPAANIVGSISVGQSKEGNISTPGERIRYSLSLSNQSNLVFRLDKTYGSNLDTYISLYDQHNNKVGFNDDGGEGLNSLLRINLRPGQYIVEVRSLGNRTGGYMLSVERGGGY